MKRKSSTTSIYQDVVLHNYDISVCLVNRENEGKKGHHDKEEHEGEYDEKSGHKKKHQDESGLGIGFNLR